MKTENVIQTKNYAFALRIVRLYQHLSAEKKEFVLSKQVLLCGTSIGANVEEAIGGQSRADFVSKMSYRDYTNINPFSIDIRLNFAYFLF